MIISINKLLIVDDNAAFRQQVKDLLATEPNINVVGEAADGQEAILKARTLKPDLILLDVKMPGINGIEVAHRLKAEMALIKIIFLSAYDLKPYRDAAVTSGAEDYIVKKDLVTRLVPAVRQALQPDFLGNGYPNNHNLEQSA